VDANVLLRYLTADDPKQDATASRLFEDCSRRQERLLLPTIVLCEIVWTLDRRYGQRKPQIVQALTSVLEAGIFEIECEPLVRSALYSYVNGKGDFADYLIGAVAAHHGCRDTVTFDKKLKGAAGFTVLA
jgi:predicted nucleic-acid-binding protein